MKKEEKNQLKKDRILQAAKECFARFGYEKTTMDDIALAVQLNKATLYYYYANKEDIFTAAVLRESEVYIRDLQQRSDATLSPDERVVQYLIERLRYHNQVVNMHELSMQFLKTITPIFDQLYQGILQQEIQFVSKIISEGIDNQFFISCDSYRVSQGLFAVANAIKYMGIQANAAVSVSQLDYAPIEAEIVFLTQLILKGIKSK